MAIVIIDDSMTHLVILKHLAKSQSGHSAIMFSEAGAAIDFLGESASELIIVDCEMPGMDGITFIQRIRQMPQHGKTPIMMVTNHTEPEVRMRAMEAGVTEFLSKPVVPADFRLRVTNLIRMSLATHAA